MQVSTVLEIKNLTAEGYYSITGSRGLQLRVTKYGKEFYFRYSWTVSYTHLTLPTT